MNQTRDECDDTTAGMFNTTFIKKFLDPAHGVAGPREKVDVFVSKIQRVTSSTIEENTQQKIHFWRARMFLKIAKLYTEKAWFTQKKPRKFYLLYRGFDLTSSKESLVEYKKNYLQLSLSSIERALALQHHTTNKHCYYECIKLKAHILCTLSACDEYSERRRCEQALECLLVLNELEEQEQKEEGKGTKEMIIYIAHAVSEKNGSWENLVQLEKRFDAFETSKKKRAANNTEEEAVGVVNNDSKRGNAHRDDYSNYFNELEYDGDDREALESIIDSIIIT